MILISPGHFLRFFILSTDSHECAFYAFCLFYVWDYECICGNVHSGCGVVGESNELSECNVVDE